MKKALIILVSLFIFFAGAQTVFAEDTVFVKDYGLAKTADAAKLSTGGTVQGIAGNVIGAGLTMVGVLFLVLMIYGGITWMLARGNEQQSKKASDTLIAAAIGLVIVLSSYALTNFVFTSVENKPAGGTASCKDMTNPPDGTLCQPSSCTGSAENVCLLNNICCVWQ